jgi:hypothetical protein
MAEGNAITVKIGAETDGIERGLSEIQNSLKKIEKSGADSGESFNGSFLKMAGAVAVGQAAVNVFGSVVNGVFSAAQKVVDGFSAALDLGGTLSDLSSSTGETAGNLLLLQRAFDNTGAGADKVGPALAKLQDKINSANEGSAEASIAFGRMGVSLEDLAGKTPTQQLALVASGISSIEDPSKRAATAIDIFGKSGAELLPLLTNFSGEMTEAGATVGSMADIMDRRANVFDAVGDRFLIIQQKVRDFAAGILDKALPAIDAITSALSRIDAAAVGQNLANAFLGGQQAMKGFQAAVDAISIGQAGLAFEVFWESLKLQAMQTADEIYKRLIAAFQSAGQFLAEIFNSTGALFTTVVSSFEFLANKLSVTIQRNLANALAGNWLTEGIALQLNTAANDANTAANKIEDSLKGAGGRIADQFVNAGKAFPDTFEKNYAKVPPLFDGIAAQQNKVAELEGKVAAATTATNAERAAGNQALTLTGTLTEQLSTVEAALTEAIANGNTQLAEQLDKQKGILENKIQAKKLETESKALKTEIVGLETSLNEAKAAGNAELVASLEKQLEQKKATEEIAKLTDDYVKTLGVTKEEAGVLATNFVNAKNAAAAVKVDKTTVAEAKAEASKAAEAAKSFATWLDYIKGVDPSKPVKSLKEQTADARKEITAFGEYIGVDLKNKSFPDIARELGVKTLGTTGKEQMDAILAHIASKRGELTGIQPIDEKGGRASLENLTAKIASLGTTPQTITLDASKSIENIKGEFKKNMDLAISTGEGGKILGEIKTFVSEIKSLVGKIEPKLPVAALSV